MNVLSALLGAMILLGAAAPAPVPPPSPTLAERALQSHTGMIPQFLPGATPDELDKRIPLPAGVLVGSVVMTPWQSFGDHGSPGFIDIFYDMPSAQATADYAGTLGHAGWRIKPPGPVGAALYCLVGAPSILVTSAPALPLPLGGRLQLTVFRNRPGIDPCK